MRREDFTTDVDTDDQTPQLTVAFDGTPQLLRDRLGGDEPLTADELDVAYRQTPSDEPGVLSVTNRLTGEYILEAPLSSVSLRNLVDTADQLAEDERQYRLRIEPGDGDAHTFEKATLLVYDADGNLDREASLIPGGVEL